MCNYLKDGDDPIDDLEDIAQDFKDAMQTNITVYIILTAGCALSFISGPFLSLRWLSIPFNLLIGVSMHIYAILVLYLVRNSDGGEFCAEQGTDRIMEDAEWIDDVIRLQLICFVPFTILATTGCL